MNIDIFTEQKIIKTWSVRYKETPYTDKDHWKAFEKLTGLKFKDMEVEPFLDSAVFRFTKGRKTLTFEGYSTKAFIMILDVPMPDDDEVIEVQEEEIERFHAGDMVTFEFRKAERTGHIKEVKGRKVTVEFDIVGKKKVAVLDDSKLTKKETRK